MDGVLYGMDQSKVAYIITSQPRVITEEIDRQMDRGVTYLHGEGSFSGEEKLVLMCAFKQPGDEVGAPGGGTFGKNHPQSHAQAHPAKDGTGRAAFPGRRSWC